MKVKDKSTGQVFDVLDTDYAMYEDGSYVSPEPDMVRLVSGWRSVIFYEWVQEE